MMHTGFGMVEEHDFCGILPVPITKCADVSHYIQHTHRSMFLPYKLTPNLISFSGFEAGKTMFTGTVLIGTGHKGSHKMKHSTAQNAIQKLMRGRSEAELHLTLLYSNNWYKPYSKLCQTVTSLSSIENDISPKRH